MKWTLRQPKRFLEEQEALDRLAQDANWIKGIHWHLNDALAVTVDLDLEIHGRIGEVDLTYPDAFPDTPAYIRPRDRSQRWSGHEYGEGGSFCLEWRADNWHPGVTGADLVQSLYRLLSAEQHPDKPAPVPSAHHLTRGQEMRSRYHRLIATPRLMEVLTALPPNSAAAAQMRMLLHSSATTGVVTAVANAGGTHEPIADIPAAITSYIPLFTWRSDGYVLKSSGFRPDVEIATADELRALIARLGFADQVVLTREPGSTQFGDIPVLVVGNFPEAARCWGVDGAELHSYAFVRGEDSGQRLPPFYAGLKDIRIGIAGLGSLGSKIAISLARSGCRKFLLIDEDLFLPENVCRNELSWDSIGVHKAEAVKEALGLIAAAIDVDVRLHRLAGQESSVAAASVLKALAGCDLIIDATAKPDVFTLLASIACANRRALCWGEVFAGGIGGLIARARPGHDPAPLSVRNGILERLRQLPPAPYVNATRYDVEDDEPLVADDADVSHIASAVARLALDTLLERLPTSFPYPAYLIGLRADWIFSGAFDTQPIEVTGEGWDVEAPNEEDRNATLARLIEMLKEATDDHADSAAADPGHNPNGTA